MFLELKKSLKRNTMIKLLTETLLQLQVVKVQVHPHSVRKQITLFESEHSPEISFNGHKHTSEYHDFLDSIYRHHKLKLEEKLNNESLEPEILLKSLDLYRFEVREFKNRYFPKENTQVLFNRVEFIKTPLSVINDDIELKKKLLAFLQFNSNLSKCLSN